MSKKTEIEDLLKTFWDKRVIEITEDPLSTDDLFAPLDSVTACEALIDIDELLKTKVPVEVVIRHGGYESQEQFVELVTAGVMKHVEGIAS